VTISTFKKLKDIYIYIYIYIYIKFEFAREIVFLGVAREIVSDEII